MEIFEANNIIIFIMFFIPGFISLKVYHLVIASNKFNFTESFGEAVAFSSFNYAALSWLIILVFKYDLFHTNLFLFIVVLIFVMFFAPIIWTIVFIKLSKSKILRKYILGVVKSPWDFYFENRKSCWVIVNLKNGESIGGVYSKKSCASAFPHKEQIYLEELWNIDSNKNFIESVNRTNGIIILGDEIESLEFFNNLNK